MLEFKDSDVFVKLAQIIAPDHPRGPVAAWLQFVRLKFGKGHVALG